MLIKFTMTEAVAKKIEELVSQGAYSDFHQFLSVAVANQLQEELSTTTKLKTNSNDSFSELSLAFKSAAETKVTDQNITTQGSIKLGSHWRHVLSDIQIENSQLEPKSSELIWYFYNRFFPIKVVVYQLARMMVTQRQNWIALDDLQVQAFEFAEEISTKLKNIEISARMARNKKLSTGLPASRMELIGLRGAAKRKKEDKLLKGRTRFMDQIIGKYVRKDRIFFGAGFDLGLTGVKYENESCYVSLTEIGKEFALLENPILDKDSFESAFSHKEVEFIFHKIYSKFRLENIIVRKIIELLKKGSLTSSQIDDVFKNEHKEFIPEERIATMGRLSELKVVNWQIDSEGKSIYSLNEEKAQILN